MILQALLNLVPFFLICGSLAGLPETSAQGTAASPILDAQTDAFINKILADWKSPGGVGVALVKKNDQGQWVNIETKGYGRATASGKAVTENTTFNIGSNSKLFTVAATSLLINNQTLSPRLNWDSKISSVISNFNVTDPVTLKEATLLDLMTHRTGYPRHEFSYRYSDDVPAVINKMHSWRQSYEFRDVWQYNNNMYTLLSYLPPTLLSGKPFARYVKENIFDPLNMTATTYSYQLANSNGQRADGMARKGIDYYKDPFAGTPAAAKYWSSQTGGEDGSVLSGAGGVISSAVDMAKWLQTLLLDGVHPTTNQTVIPPGALQKAASALSIETTQPNFPEESLIAYGAAQVQITYRGHLIIEHPGFVRGFNTQVSRLPNDGLGVAVLTNDNEHGKSTSQIIKYYLMDRALGLEPIDWSGRLMAQKSVPPTRATPRPANATLPSANFTSLAGVYNNAGYGQFELCLISPPNPSASTPCQAMASNISSILPNAIRPGIPTLVGAIDSPWLSHFRIEHFNQDLFNVSLLISTAQNDTTEPYWTYNDRSQSDNGAIAELDAQGSQIGLGMAGIWYGLWEPNVPPATPKPKGNTVRERAEVYWDKIN
ncbi:Gigasin-6 [Hypsizygus marmoreus]|uniref:Gigasin-6 n=1 Tax=Hypsizygus marmoreus TaxID=39966 RepID=A0A369K7X4_HYPMA|nr:Gigasin-6 [Hypsizygus marmoreus]